ncbi:MAG TPA: glucose-6-phosphate dehydrogenase assembly protein OpcA, partial [Thermomicrobiales bacterium]|nr:glucose-6-phosphate dehydrogenase assembly protein OpcA [Thermomicrobiales bacterium]
RPQLAAAMTASGDGGAPPGAKAMASTAPLAADRAAARPIPDATWSAHVADAGVITTELNRLWAQVGRIEDRGRIDGDGVPSLGIQTRASTLNLTTVARSRLEAARVEEAVMSLSELYPSRATILVADPERPEAHRGLDVKLVLLEQPASKGRPAVRFECVIVEASAANERQLASIASPLLVVDLPDFLWWASDSILGSMLFEDLCAISDRIIVDTAAAPQAAAELRALAALPAHGDNAPRLSDFAWARVATWRAMTTQFFDTPSGRASLDALDRIEIDYGLPEADRRSGFTTALLVVGWLASRLGWSPPGAMVPTRGVPNAWHLTFRAGPPFAPREIVVDLRPSPAAFAGLALGRVALLAGGGALARYEIERISDMEVRSTSQVENGPEATRTVFDLPEGESGLLADELRIFNRDTTYEAALAVASVIAPVGPRFGNAG